MTCGERKVRTSSHMEDSSLTFTMMLRDCWHSSSPVRGAKYGPMLVSKKNRRLRNGMSSSNYLKTCWRNQTIQALQLLWELFWSKRVIYCEFEAHLLINKYWYLSIKVATPWCMAQRVYTCKGHDVRRTLPYVWCTPFDRTELILQRFKRLRRSEEGGICDKRIPRSR